MEHAVETLTSSKQSNDNICLRVALEYRQTLRATKVKDIYGLTIQNLGERSSHFRPYYRPYTYPSWPLKTQGFKDKFGSAIQGKSKYILGQ